MAKRQRKAAPAGFTVPEGFHADCVKAHNEYRALHGCPPLSLNANLSKFAQEWANNLASRNAMEHRNQNKYGENIYFSSGQQVNATMPVKMWYDEIAQYNFEAAKFAPNVGHFTQVIWKNTREVGVGIAIKGKSTWVVANYNPPGNVMGQFKEQVPPKT